MAKPNQHTRSLPMSTTYIVASSIIAFILLCPFLWSCWMMIFKTQKFMTTIMNFVHGESEHFGLQEIGNLVGLLALSGLIMLLAVIGVFIGGKLTMDILEPKVQNFLWEVPTLLLIIAVARFDYWAFMKNQLKDHF